MNDTLVKMLLIYGFALLLSIGSIGCGRLQARIIRGGPVNPESVLDESYQIKLSSNSTQLKSKTLIFSAYVYPPSELEILGGDQDMYATLTVGAETCTYVYSGDRMELDTCTVNPPLMAEAGDDASLHADGSLGAAVSANLTLINE